MKLPKGLPNDVVLRTWMDNRKNNDSNMQSTSFVSPMWEQTSESHPRLVTLNLRPFRTTNFSLDSFMASHCPRRNCSNRQKFMLKPLDQRNVSTNIHPAFGINSATSFSTDRLLQESEKAERPSSNCSQDRERKVSASVVTLGDYESSKQNVPDGICTFRNTSFRPSPKFSQATGQKIPIGNTFGFNCPTGYFNLLQQEAEIVARGTPVLTVSQKQEAQLKPAPRWKSKTDHVLNDKVSKYPDPMIGASSSFQGRLAEVAQHELDTVKWEKGKKGRKKHLSSS